MRSIYTVVLVTGVLAASITGCKSKEKPKEPEPVAATTQEKPLTYEDSVDITVTAKVKSIDYPSRVVTLEDTSGHAVTFWVDPVVKRLNEVKVGDEVTTRYRASLLAELRAPTADETANPISIVSMGGRAAEGADPSASVAQVVRVVTTVAAVDVPNMLVTLRGPMGDLAVVRGRKAENVKRLHIGDTIVISYTESVALSLEKIAPR